MKNILQTFSNNFRTFIEAVVELSVGSLLMLLAGLLESIHAGLAIEIPIGIICSVLYIGAAGMFVAGFSDLLHTMTNSPTDGSPQ